MENKGGGKRPDYQVVSSTGDGLKKRGAAWKNISKQGNPYLSIVMEDGAKYMLLPNKPKPENTTQNGYGQSNYGQRDNQRSQSNQEPQRLGNVVDMDDFGI